MAGRVRNPVPSSTAAGWAIALVIGLVIGLGGCGDEESLPPAPLPSAGGDGTGGSDDGGMISAGPGGTDGGGDAAHCELMPEAADDGSGDAAETEGGFKFDVGAPPGGTDFPVSCDEVAETASNLGCEFWAVDLPNDYRGTPMSPPAAEQQFAVVVANASSLEVAVVDVFVGGEADPIDTYMVDPGAVETLELAQDLGIEPRETTRNGSAYRIESSVPITAYQFNPLDNQVEVYSNDASLLLPTHALGKDYTAVSANAILLGMTAMDPDPVNAGAFISVVATRDDTDVNIMPTASIVGSPSMATLDTGEVLTVISDAMGAAGGNFSGSRITASRKVAVFAGNVATAIPSNTPKCCADHVEHQLPPSKAWGTAYGVAPPPSPVADEPDPAVYRFVAANDDTELRYCPTMPVGAPELLMAGETAVITSSVPFTVESDPDKPFSVTQFLQSNQQLSDSQPGDPAMIVVASLGQFQRRYLFAVPAGYAQNYVTIVTRGEGEVRLDDEVIAADDFLDVGVARGQVHRYVSLQLSDGAHLVEAEVPVGITVVGFDQAVSYGYPGGAGLRVIAVPPTAG